MTTLSNSPHLNSNDKLDHCPALITIQAISGKWKTRILWLLRDSEMNFGELKKQLSGISAKMLTEHLRQLQADKLIGNRIIEVGDMRYSSYFYSEYGKTLIPVLDAMGEWGLGHSGMRPDNLSPQLMTPINDPGAEFPE